MTRKIAPCRAHRAARIIAAATLALTVGVAAGQALPQQGRLGAITYVSGGIGSDEAQYMQSIRQQFNLHLLFAASVSGQYLADVRVDIDSAAGTTLASLVSDGPFFYARLPEGVYRLRVSYKGVTQAAAVDLRQGRQASLQFYWPGVE